MKRIPAIFVLDDNDAVLAAVAELLKTSGYATECFKSAVNFLARCGPRQVGCLVVDPTMPGIDGRKFLARVRELHSRLSVVVVKHDAPAGDAAEWFARGATAVLRKPFDAAEFLAAVDRAVAESLAQYDP